MKNTPDAYERYLSTYLSNNNYPEAEDLSFITARADQAYDVFCEARRGGVDVSTAEELALIALMQGYQGESFDDLVREILFDYCPEEGYDFFISDMEDRLEDYREQYSPDKYPPYSAEYEAFKTELLGVIDDYFTTYLPTE
ncbi:MULTISPECIES: DUF1896 family protein [Bacteroidales]|jgi:hypothetical protein|uniref:DUF1896 family protein n=1 Tax=Bacteroidales TaxID=171549 RepID=UPI000F47D977|nr:MULTISPECIES: DUF1896 family protein [Bacteroidales]MBJ2196587.1 DUF1896 family protein [Muribaculaceae bacterium]MCI9028651.1 DUF1896 domain-containing protein [Muribaculaceae bacterium]ROT18231.1 DUF1896 family protein [Muribaculaceae bacterium Isolate-114 (HZI)]ROT18435.1 DUF1896 family protein [Muribaculaceae bacterium Isolate-113 (HZI)]